MTGWFFLLSKKKEKKKKKRRDKPLKNASKKRSQNTEMKISKESFDFW